MRSAVLLLVASLVASASAAAAAADIMAIPNIRRKLSLLPRQTDSPADKCVSEALDVASSIPSPPPALLSDLEAHPQTDPCHFSLPQSLSKDFSSYSVEVLSWYKDNKTKLDQLVSDCSVLTSYSDILPHSGLVPVCTAARGSGGDSSPAPAPASASATATGGAAKTANAAAPRETGMAFAALAVAGLAAAL